MSQKYCFLINIDKRYFCDTRVLLQTCVVVSWVVEGGAVGVVDASVVEVATVVLTTGGIGTGSGTVVGTGVDDTGTVGTSGDVSVTGGSDDEGGGSLNVSRMVIVCWKCHATLTRCVVWLREDNEFKRGAIAVFTYLQINFREVKGWLEMASIVGRRFPFTFQISIKLLIQVLTFHA